MMTCQQSSGSSAVGIIKLVISKGPGVAPAKIREPSKQLISMNVTLTISFKYRWIGG